ncbi:ankyrin repeat domain-containing protein [Acaryochloris marina]|uniref:ankyrin repeat domain-containing protein n=1 Tax=Acaryochloris marina TaxID=155978 RepID=UPI001BAF96F6|nr:ankyrin repeat domain-containing protein [Acaryochloris marina]QUY46192.1 ankyrin repeat domain-containing protein [Acaryochloris marina S15]
MSEKINPEWLNLRNAIKSNQIDKFTAIFCKKKWSEHDLVHALVLASKYESLEILLTLIKYGADINLTVGEETALATAVDEGNYEIASILLDAGANPSLPINSEVHPPLFIAANNGDLDIVKLLVNAGANVNQTICGEPPIINAALSGHQNIYNFLLPMTQSELLGDAEYFLQKGIRQNFRDENINPIMENAYDVVRKGSIGEVKKLLTGNIPINDFTQYGSTLLNSAVIRRPVESRLPVTLALLESGADPNLADDYDDMTPIMRTRQIEIISTLINFGADVNAMTHDKTTALIEASKYRHSLAVKVLLESGADPKHKDSANMNAMDYALENQHSDIILFFKESA